MKAFIVVAALAATFCFAHAVEDVANPAIDQKNVDPNSDSKPAAPVVQSVAKQSIDVKSAPELVEPDAKTTGAASLPATADRGYYRSHYCPTKCFRYRKYCPKGCRPKTCSLKYKKQYKKKKYHKKAYKKYVCKKKFRHGYGHGYGHSYGRGYGRRYGHGHGYSHGHGHGYGRKYYRHCYYQTYFKYVPYYDYHYGHYYVKGYTCEKKYYGHHHDNDY